MRNCLCLNIVLGWTPLHLSAQEGNTEVTKVDEKLFVFKYCIIFIVLGLDTSTPVSTGGKHRGDKGSSGRRGLTVCC